MKKKFAFLSLISALAIGASFAFTACGNKSVGEHDHEWDEGTVTTESTCYKEGVRTYSCKVEGCKQTKTAPVAMIAHSWNDGEVTSQPTCSKEGVKTYTCTVEECKKTKTEAVDKTDHRYDDGKITKVSDFLTKGKKTFTCLDCQDEKVESVEAHADFSEQFYTALNAQNNWYYGYMTSFGAQTGADDFKQTEQNEGGVWKAEGIEVGNGYVFGDNAAIAYRFAQELPEKTQTNVSVSFSGEDSATRLNAYLIINGECVETVEENTKDWSYQTENAIDIAKGDTFCIVFKNAGEGKAGGNLAITFTAPCVHVWDSGKVTKESTCTAEGAIEYNCISCDKKITEATEKTDHVYGNGTVTTEPTETVNGEKTYKCINCDDTSTEPVLKLGANYKEDFSLEGNNGWEYGYTADYNFDNNTFTFSKLNPNGNNAAWTDNGGGIEIKSDWLKNETGGANAVVRYDVQTTREVYISVDFNGSNEVTRITGRVHILKPDGSVQLCDFVNGSESSSWTYDKKVTVEAGSAISVLFFNEGDGGWYHGQFSMTISSNCLHRWNAGEVTTQPTCSTDGVKTFTCLNCGETKTETITERPGHDFTGDWINDSAEGHYHKCSRCDATDNPVEHAWEDVEVKTPPTYEDEGVMKTECTVCHRESTRPIPASNHVKGTAYGKDETNHWFVCSAHTDCGITFGKEAHHSDNPTRTEPTLYNDGSVEFDCECGEHIISEVLPARPANFKEDFTAEEQTGAWSYGYSEYHWNNGVETFDFHKSETFEDGAWKADGVQIKNDWIDAGGNATIAYTFTEDVIVKLKLTFTGGKPNTRVITRIGVKHKDGTQDSNPEGFWAGNDNNSWEINKYYSFLKGDTIYIIFFNEGNSDKNKDLPEAYPNGNVDITFTKKEVNLAFNGANFKDDFTAEEQTGAWSYGHSVYHWNDGVETFDFYKSETFEDGAWKANDVQIKNDWIDAGGNATIAYTFNEDANAKLTLTFTGGKPNTRVITRIGVKHKDGTQDSNPEGFWAGNDENSWQVEKNYSFKDGDTIYIIFFNEGNSDKNKDLPEAYPNGNIDITIEKA